MWLPSSKPEDAFEVSNAGQFLNVPSTLDRGLELLEQEPDESFVGPFATGEASTIQAKARTYTPLPHRYVNIFLVDQYHYEKGTSI